MIHYVPICFTLALLGTLLANPVFYYQLFKTRKEYKKALKKSEDAKKKGESPWPVYKSHYSIFEESPIGLIIGQLILFILVFAGSSWELYFFGNITPRFSTILAYLWIPAISQFLNFVILVDKDTSFSDSIEESIVGTFGLIVVIFLIIPSLIGIHKGCYNYLYPYDDITIVEDKYAEYPTVDETFLLEKANLADGSSLKEPVYRNNNWVYPVENNNSHVSSSGYLIVDSRKITFVQKDIVYSPWSNSKNKVDLVVRKHLPNVVFFGSTTFQIEPETQDVYFCQFYGDYAFFRAGRKVEGAILVNATTGECTCYSMNEIPNWVTGISF